MREVVIATISAIIGGIVTLVIDRINERRKEKKEKIKKIEEYRKNRPEFKIIEMHDYFDKPGEYIDGRKCDLSLFVIPIDGIEIDQNHVSAIYDVSMLDKSKWVSREYVLENIGNVAVYELKLISNNKKSTCIFDFYMMNEKTFELGLINYNKLYDRRIGPQETITLQLFYNKEKIQGSWISASMDLGMRDDNGHYWIQSFFAPDDKLYESYRVTYEEYRERSKTDSAIECFKKPHLW